MWQGWEKWGDPSWKPGVSQEKMPPWRGGWVSSDLHPLEVNALSLCLVFVLSKANFGR